MSTLRIFALRSPYFRPLISSYHYISGKTDLADHNVFIVDTQQEALKKPAFFAQCKIEDDGLDVHVQNQNR